MLQLEDFITETIKQIINGTVSAQKHASEHNAGVAPGKMQFRSTEGGQLWNQKDGTPIQQVDFDVAVTTTEGTEAKGGAGIFVGSFGVGAQGKSDYESSSISRIRFKIPLQLPSQPGS